MATLEKIRSKSGFLIVVIGLALLAFIVGDALTNSRNLFGDHTTVAKMGSAKVDITEYQRKREELNQQLEEARRNNPASVANFDMQTLPQIAITSLLQEQILSDHAEKAGIEVTGNLLRFYMLESPQPSQEVMLLVSQLNQSGLSVQTPQQAYEVIFNPKRNGLTEAQVEPYRRLWLAAEAKTQADVARQIYYRLVQKSVKANDLDKKALYNDYVNTAKVELAYLPYGTLTEKEYPVSDSELKKAYEEYKKDFTVKEDTKDVQFIAISVTPSQKDQADSKALAQRTVQALSDSTGQVSKDIKKEGVAVTHHSLRAADLPSTLKETVTTTPKGGVKLVSDNLQGFTVIRVTGSSLQTDSIQINTVMTATEDLGRRVLAALNSGLKADSITARYSVDSVVPQLNQWIPLYTANGRAAGIDKATVDSIVNAGGKYVTLQAGPQGMVMASLVTKKAPVMVYDYDEATYVLGPSPATLNGERARLEKFLAANPSAKDFAANAAKEGFNVQRFSLTQSAPAVPRMMGMNSYYPDSRQVVRWVMIDGEAGDVSRVYESKSNTNPMLYAVAVESSYDKYVPLSNPEVKNYMTEKVRRQKAGDKLMAQYSKKTQSLQSAAQAMGVEARTIDSFRFGYNAGVNDQAVMGKINGTKADKKVEIVKGDDGIYVYQVMDKKKENFPYNEQQYTQQYFQMINPNLMEMLQGDARIKNNIYKFEAGE